MYSISSCSLITLMLDNMIRLCLNVEVKQYLLATYFPAKISSLI